VIQCQSHSTIYVIDQEEALKFYRDILSFEVNTDMTMDDSGLRWLTLNPKGQPDLEVILAQVTPGPMFDAGTAEEMKALVERGAFETDDIQSDYERLSNQGVDIVSPPQERFYGTEAIVKDNSGNWFSLTQSKR
jgi:uncharacterized glyoxalase superfamily protein PhnB